MKFTTSTIFFTLFVVFSMVCQGTLGLPVVVRDVYNPPITFPTAGDTFLAGQTIVVTWDTSSLPKGLPNKGLIMLGYYTPGNEHLDFEHPLASDFLLTDGFHEITFGDLPEGDNYILALFGDSGNISQQFTILSKN